MVSLPCFCVFLAGRGGLPHFHLKLSAHAATSTPPKVGNQLVDMPPTAVFAQQPKAQPLRLCNFGATTVFACATACAFAPRACPGLVPSLSARLDILISRPVCAQLSSSTFLLLSDSHRISSKSVMGTRLLLQ